MFGDPKRLGREEIARRGDEIYETSIQPNVRAEDAGRYAVIDVRSGEYEIDTDEMTASDRLLARRPKAEVWLRQIGSHYARRFGPRPNSLLASSIFYTLS